jgi:hypothetical protein
MMSHHFSIQGPKVHESAVKSSTLAVPAFNPRQENDEAGDLLNTSGFSQENYKHNLHSTWLAQANGVEHHDKFGFTSSTASRVASRDVSPDGREEAKRDFEHPNGISTFPGPPERLRSCENPHMNDDASIASCFTCARDLLLVDTGIAKATEDRQREGQVQNHLEDKRPLGDSDARKKNSF